MIERVDDRIGLRLWSQDGQQSYSFWTSPPNLPLEYIRALWSPKGDVISVMYWDDGAWLVLLDPEGNEIATLQSGIHFYGGDVRQSNWSPDGSTLAYAGLGPHGQSDIFLIDADSGNPEQLMNTIAKDSSPLFSPDGRQLLWNTDGAVRLMDLETGEWRPMPFSGWGYTWAPDGTNIAYSYNGDIYITNLETGEKTRLTFDGRDMDDRGPLYDPSGQWLLFWSYGWERAGVRIPRLGDLYYLIDLLSMDAPALIGSGSFGAHWTSDGSRVVFQGWEADNIDQSGEMQYFAFDPRTGSLEIIPDNGEAIVNGLWNPNGEDIVAQLPPSAAVITSTPNPMMASNIDLNKIIAFDGGLELNVDGGLQIDRSADSDWYGMLGRPIPLDGRFTVHITAELGGENSYISLCGSLTSIGETQDRPCLYIGRYPEGDMFLRFYDAQQVAQPDIILPPRIGNGETFTIEFLDSSGIELEIFDGDGQFVRRVSVPDLWKIDLPNGLFAEQEFFPGVLVGPNCTLMLQQFEIEFPDR